MATEESLAKHKVSQWVSSIVNLESKSSANIDYLNNILGPIKTEIGDYIALENDNLDSNIPELPQNISSESSSSGGYFTHQIIFEISEEVFIESLNIYEKVVADSSLMKIEAFNKDKNHNDNRDEWFTMWETQKPLAPVSRPQIFSPNIKKPPFKTQRIRITISGSLHLIEGIEVKGNKFAVDSENVEPLSESENLKNYSFLSRHLYKLIENEQFADVYFEIEAMLGEHSVFKESSPNQHTMNNPVYIKDISYVIFKQVLNYLYTGHINHKSLPYYAFIGLMKAADLMNLQQLEQLCLFHLSELINPDNVIKIYIEASESPEILKEVIKMCYDVITSNFSHVSRGQDFCSLPQDLMLKIIENVIPKLSRLTSIQVNGAGGEQQANVLLNNLNDDDTDEDDEDEDDDVDSDD